jgi:hypothetical protein
MVEDITAGANRDRVEPDDGPTLSIHLIAQQPDRAPGKIKFEMILNKSPDYEPNCKMAELVACCATALHLGLRMMEKGPIPVPPGLPLADLATHAAALAERAVAYGDEAAAKMREATA